MSEMITQMRLAMRLDGYLREYTEKNVGNNHVLKQEWDVVWNMAEHARAKSELTPVLVDDVRRVLQKL